MLPNSLRWRDWQPPKTFREPRIRTDKTDKTQPKPNFVGFVGSIPVDSDENNGADLKPRITPTEENRFTSVESEHAAFAYQSTAVEETRVAEMSWIREAVAANPAEHPDIPRGLRLIRWVLMDGPIQISRCETVVDVPAFITSTLRQVESRLRG